MCKMSRVLIAVAFVITVVGLSSPAYGEYHQTALTAHNTHRAAHGAVPMHLDSSLSTAAQNCAVYYAQKQTIDHSCTTSGAGENLYMTWGSSTPPASDTVTTKAINSWYAENSGYNYADPGSSSGVTGHFTQMVWNSSTTLGIGVGTSGTYTVVVGKYEPQGNIYWYGSDQYIKFKENVFAPE